MTSAGEHAWRVSTHSNGTNCTGVIAWRKPSRSMSNGHCAELAATARGVAVRDSKDRGGPAALLGPAAWAAFTRDLGAAVTPGSP